MWHHYGYRRGGSICGLLFGIAVGAFAMNHHIKHRVMYGDRPHGHMRHWNLNHYNSYLDDPIYKMRQIVKEKANLSDD